MAAGGDDPGDDEGREQSYLPDFCSGGAVLAVVVIAEIVAVILSLARTGPTAGFLLDLSTTSLFVQWLALASAALLCRCRGWFAHLEPARALTASFVLLMLVTLAISEIAWRLGGLYGGTLFTSHDHAGFLLRNLAISALVSAMMLRYFYVAGEWRRNVELEARSRVSALQARIRPHFFFNSMNTIAALTRSDPARAEEAIEDLSDLFRATLERAGGEGRERITLKEELEVARIYQRIEQLRLGERLRVEWDVARLPMRALVPALTVQPLLENAIYHGIEPLPDGGTIRVSGRARNGGRAGSGRHARRRPGKSGGRDRDVERGGDDISSDNRRRDGEESEILLCIENPVAPGRERKPGNRLALANVRQRFELAYGRGAEVTVEETAERYSVTLAFPYREAR